VRLKETRGRRKGERRRWGEGEEMKRRKRPRACSRTVLPGNAPKQRPKSGPAVTRYGAGQVLGMPPDESAPCPPSHKVLDHVE
jgi:hypothetical protein